MNILEELKKNGHGHVVARTDGTKARCGGPGMCTVCKSEKVEVDALGLKKKEKEDAADSDEDADDGYEDSDD